MEVTGPEKAVLLLLSLDEATAVPILSELDPSEIRKLREAASLMRAVPAKALDQVYGEFVQKSREAVAVPRGGVRYLKRIATRALGEARSNEIFVDAPQTALDRLAACEPSQLAPVLENEHPQLVAAVLSQLEPLKAARVLEQMPDQHRARVLARLGTMTEVPAGLLEEVATALGAELPGSDIEAVVSVDGVSRTAALVKRMRRENGDAVLGALSESNEGLANEIRKAMYSFDDLAILDARAMRSLLEAAPLDRLTVALKGASDALKARVFGSLSKRAAERVREDMDALGNVKASEIELAKQAVLDAALRLQAEGVISLNEEEH